MVFLVFFDITNLHLFDFQNGVELVTCLCNNKDYCNGTSNLVGNVHLLISMLVLLIRRHGCGLDVENERT